MYVTLMHINPTVGANQTSRFLNIAVPDQLGILSSSLNVIRVHTYHTVSSDSWFYEEAVSMSSRSVHKAPESYHSLHSSMDHMVNPIR